MKRKGLVAIALALTLAMGIVAAPAWAYFTDNTMATGGLKIGKPTTSMTEYVKEMQKHLTIKNEDTSGSAVFVRAQVFATDGLTESIGGDGWSGPVDGWYYYGSSATSLTALDPGASANELLVKVKTPTVKTEADDVPASEEFGENFNVIIVYESAPVMYDDDGNAYADWTGEGATHAEEQNGGE